jgi:pyruvate formate lyase activating enzyme
LKTTKLIPVGGFQKQSLIDYPGYIASVIFTCGCNFRCRYCHNAQLIDPDYMPDDINLNEENIIAWIQNNYKLLDAIVITGGEPTLHSSLPFFISRLKELGLNVKLDTNGTNPDMLDRLITDKLVDYVAMDIKAPLTLMKYKKVVGNGFNDPLLEKVLRSIRILNQKRVNCEFRTTVDESLSMDDFISIAGVISGNYYIQNRMEGGKVVDERIELKYVDSIQNLPPPAVYMTIYVR